MARVVPNDVVKVIDQLFPGINTEAENQIRELNYTHLPQVTAVLKLAQQISAELITVSSEKYGEYLACIAVLRSRARVWETQGNTLAIHHIPGMRQRSPIGVIRDVLSDCPDQIPSAKTAELKFIRDKQLRASLRLDISSVNSGLSNGEWKNATVLAGSVIEALLLWGLERRPQIEIRSAIRNLFAKKIFTQQPPKKLEDWVLYQYIAVATELKLISDETATATRLAKGFRNLIHPGRAKRLGQECNRGTALSAVAALEHVITDLSP